ncbi:hypothetical protein B0T22DRAFT_194239 [Podospora appendiculata]|uniref:Oxidoreductase-like protein n=1 Tax=Podospora appendiculata TaxID=314037 RepID=A0AAE1CEH6_9PEZI|nr:hypothetical protein B0T22DRAFT_194239 [Podospora appendiculata]
MATTTPVVVEARSLSDINALAANPPQYPHHPEPKESLTLYISRVPGTRDVILSTFKPQKKNVTAEDIANSLYYIHLDLPTDEHITAPRRPEDAASPRVSGESARSVIPRKPLPSSARVPKLGNSTSDSPALSVTTTATAAIVATTESIVPENTSPASAATTTGSAPPAESSPDGYQPNPMFRGRRPGTLSEALEPTPQSPSGNFARKPLGPRPQSTFITPDTVFASPHNVPGRGHQRATSLVSEPTQYTSPTSPSQLVRTQSPVKRGRRASFAPFSLTLIRRDPTLGNQWNIGKVSSFHTNIPTPDRADPNLNPHDMGVAPRARKIDIHLETSGYAKYRNMPSRANVEAYRPTSPHSQARGLAAVLNTDNTSSAAKSSKHNVIEEGFSRQVLMAYTKSWTSNIKDAFHRRERPRSQDGEGDLAHHDLVPPRPLHNRHGSSSSVGSIDSAVWAEANERKTLDAHGADGHQGADSSPLITQPGPGLKPKGYMFLSPWDGRCEFRTSTNGRSLKCRHMLDPKTAKFDPVVLAQNIRSARGETKTGRSRADSLSSALVGAKPVSELRFNLPSGEVLRSEPKDHKDGGRWNHHHLQGHFNKLLNLENRSSDDDEEGEDDGPMDLSLGKEKAGGGNRGKRAKLGKLIVHDEGLKMLDLVVAANMGVWWTTWERTF